MPRPAEMELPLRALKLIAEGPGVGPRALSQALDAPPATLARALAALLAQDFVRKEGEGYVPGPAVPLVWVSYRTLMRRRAEEAEAALRETEDEEGFAAGRFVNTPSPLVGVGDGPELVIPLKDLPSNLTGGRS